MPTVQTKGRRPFITVAISQELAAELHGWRSSQVVTPSMSATIEAMTRLGLQLTKDRGANGSHAMMVPAPGDAELCRQCKSEDAGKPERGMCTCGRRQTKARPTRSGR
jgi:hypothetical protein